MQRSFTFVLLLVVCLVCCRAAGRAGCAHARTRRPAPDAPQYALHGPYWVGTRLHG